MSINQQHLLDLEKFYCVEHEDSDECARKTLEKDKLLEKKNRDENIAQVEDRINIISDRINKPLLHNSVIFFPSYRFTLVFSANKYGPLSSAEEMFFYISCITPVYTGFLSKFVAERLSHDKTEVLSYPSILIAQPGHGRYSVFNEIVAHIGQLWPGYEFVDFRHALLKPFPAHNVTYCTDTPTLFDVLFGDIGPPSSHRIMRSIKI